MTVRHVLLICTVGGSPEPIAASLKRWRPDRAIFVPSRETRAQVEEKALPLAATDPQAFVLPVGCYEFCEIPDAQDFAGAVRKMRELAGEVARWQARGDAFEVVVDFTAGTKCMTAALALIAHPWGCRFSYVGGTERTKDSVGIVVSGKEQVLHSPNPWESLGFRAIEDAISLFDRGAYGAAAALLQGSLTQVADLARKRELLSLKVLAEAYDAWDRFDHQEARTLLGKALHSENDLRSLMGAARAEAVLNAVRHHRDHLARLDSTAGLARVADLLSNARRCIFARRYDDAVARLYRALEALAQLRLSQVHGIDSAHVPLEALPDDLRASMTPVAQEGHVWLGLQNAYALLRARGDALGECFHERGLDDPRGSSLSARNRSILAHGFEPVGEKVCTRLLTDITAVALAAGIVAEDEAQFPRLG